MPAMSCPPSRMAAAAAEIVPMLVPTSQIGAVLFALIARKIAWLSWSWLSPMRAGPVEVRDVGGPADQNEIEGVGGKQLGRANQKILAGGPTILADPAIAAGASGIQNHRCNGAFPPDGVDRNLHTARLNSFDIAALDLGSAHTPLAHRATSTASAATSLVICRMANRLEDCMSLHARGADGRFGIARDEPLELEDVKAGPLAA